MGMSRNATANQPLLKGSSTPGRPAVSSNNVLRGGGAVGGAGQGGGLVSIAAVEDPLAKVAALTRSHDSHLRALQASHDALRAEVEALRGMVERAGLLEMSNCSSGKSLADRLRNTSSTMAADKRLRPGPAAASGTSASSSAPGAGPKPSASQVRTQTPPGSQAGVATSAATSRSRQLRHQGTAPSLSSSSSAAVAAATNSVEAGKAASQSRPNSSSTGRSRSGAPSPRGVSAPKPRVEARSTARSTSATPAESSSSKVQNTRQARSTSVRHPAGSNLSATELRQEALRMRTPRKRLGQRSEDASNGMAATPSEAGGASSRGLSRSVTPRPKRGLYELAKPLLQGQMSGASTCKARLEAIRQALAADAVSPDSWTAPARPLVAAVQAGHVELTKLLLQARACVNWSDERGVSALHLAVFDGRKDLCRILLEAGADPNCRDQHGQTPLFFAPVPEICRLLVEGGADIAAMNGKGHSALHLARHAGLHDVVQWLSEHMSGPTATTSTSSSSTTAVQQGEHPEEATLLSARLPAKKQEDHAESDAGTEGKSCGGSQTLRPAMMDSPASPGQESMSILETQCRPAPPAHVASTPGPLEDVSPSSAPALERSPALANPNCTIISIASDEAAGVAQEESKFPVEVSYDIMYPQEPSSSTAATRIQAMCRGRQARARSPPALKERMGEARCTTSCSGSPSLGLKEEIQEDDSRPRSRSFIGISPVANETETPDSRPQEPSVREPAAGEEAPSDEDLLALCCGDVFAKALRTSATSGDGDRRTSDGSMPALPATSQLFSDVNLHAPDEEEENEDVEDIPDKTPPLAIASAAGSGKPPSCGHQGVEDSVDVNASPELPTTSQLAGTEELHSSAKW